MLLLEKLCQFRNALPVRSSMKVDLTLCIMLTAMDHVFSAYGGMGMTNSAAAAQTMLCVARQSASQPDALLFTGIAGNLNARLGFGDIVLGQTMVYEECDTAIIAEDPPYMEKFTATPQLLDCAVNIMREWGMREVVNNENIPQAAGLMYTPHGIRAVSQDQKNYSPNVADHQFTVGTIASSNLFSTDPQVLSRIISQDYADAEEMEGAAVAHVCAKNGVDNLIIRANSNDCGEAYEALDNREDDLNTSARIAALVTLGVAEKLLQ
ncbi:nucleosidase [Alloscardovia omnicolens]|uniref:5'-methylthioadenosine/S-adenosylhomocysteine nucleosidase family protein n=1 Tax=Alloscardovia omnicolens TaxID=419015 RepID=UPI003A679230